jgi:hypothetical protein
MEGITIKTFRHEYVKCVDRQRQNMEATMREKATHQHCITAQGATGRRRNILNYIEWKLDEEGYGGK